MTRRELIPAGSPATVRGEGLVLREWHADDVCSMVTLFDTHEMDRWTPLPSPFDEVVAAAYVEGAHGGRAAGSLQLAITEDGRGPLGEVLVFPTESGDTCELAYAVGAEHRGRHLAARAVRAVLPLARAAGYQEVRLRIAVDNMASQRVADEAGFRLSDEPLLRRERKGFVLDMATWTRAIR